MMNFPYIPPPLRGSSAEQELRERKIQRDFNTPIPVLYIVVSITILLLLIVGVVVVYVFHVG